MTRLTLIVALLLVVNGAQAVEPDEILADPVLEQRARAISKDLRCLVCQNQSIDDSDAPLARDLRIIVRERLVAGDSDTDVIAFVTQRYGDFVLLNPPVKPATYALWFGPIVLLLIGIAIVVGAMRRRAVAAAPQSLSDDERARADALLGGDQPPQRDRLP